MENWWFGILGVPLSNNPFHKRMPGIQITNFPLAELRCSESGELANSISADDDDEMSRGPSECGGFWLLEWKSTVVVILTNIGSFAHLSFRSISDFGDITVYCHILLYWSFDYRWLYYFHI